MTAHETTTTIKIAKLYDEINTSEKTIEFFKNRVKLFREVLSSTETSSEKYLIFSRHLENTEISLEDAVAVWADKMLELDKLLELGQ